MNIIFSITMTIVTGLLVYGFIKDSIRKECQDDERYKRMAEVTQVILVLVAISTLQILVMGSISCYKTCRAARRKKMNPPVDSSDEEDDKEFLHNSISRNS